MQASASANNISIAQGGTLQVANNKVLSGLIDGVASGQGTLKLSQNATLNSAIGSNRSLSMIDVAGNGLVDLQANASANNISIAQGGTLQVANNKVLSGLIDGAAAGQGTLTLSQNATLSSPIGSHNPLSLIHIGSNGLVDLQANASATNISIAGGGTLQVADNQVLSGSIDGIAAGQGTLKLSQNATLKDAIGIKNPLSLIQVAGPGLVNLQASANANNISIASGGTLQIADNKILSGLIDGAAAGQGTLKLSQNTTLKSAIGSNNPLSLINVAGGGLVDLQANASASNISIAQGGTLQVANNKTLVGQIDGNAAGQGTLKLSQNAILKDAIGSSLNPLSLINIGSNGLVDLQANANATNISIAQGGTLQVANNKMLAGLIDGVAAGQGILKLSQNATLSSAIGSNNPLSLINIGSNGLVDLQANANASNISISGGGTLQLADNKVLSGLIDGAAAGQGTLNLSQNAILKDSIGSHHPLSLIQVAGNGLVDLQTDASAINISIGQSGTLQVANNKTLTGQIDGAAAGQGTLTLSQNAILNDEIGQTYALAQLNVAGEGTVELNADVSANQISISPNGVLSIADKVAVDGLIDGTLSGQGILNFDSNGTLSQAVGSLNPLAALNLLGQGTVTLEADSAVNQTTLALGSTLQIEEGATLKGAIDGAGDNQGTLKLNGDIELMSPIGQAHSLASLDITQPGRVDLKADANVGHIAIAQGGHLNIHSNTVKGTIEGAQPNEGILTLSPNSLIQSTIGQLCPLAVLNVKGSGAAQVNENTSAQLISIGSASELMLADDKMISGHIQSQGELSFNGGGTINELTTIHLGALTVDKKGIGGKVVKVSGDEVNVGQINIIGNEQGVASGVQFNTLDQIVHANISTQFDNQNWIDFNLANAFYGTIGSENQLLSEVKLGTHQLSPDFELNGTIWANQVSLNQDMSLILKPNSVINAKITNDADKSSIIVMEDNAQIMGDSIGSKGSSISEIKILGNSVLIDSDIFASDIKLYQQSDVTLGDDRQVNANLTTSGMGSTLSLANNQVIVNGDVNVLPSDIIKLTINDEKDHGQLIVNGNASIPGGEQGTQLNVAINNDTPSSSYEIIKTQNGQLEEIPAQSINGGQTSPLIKMTTSVTGQILNLNVNNQKLSAVNGNFSKNTQSVVNTLELVTIRQPRTSELARVLAAIRNMRSLREMEFAVRELHPVHDNAIHTSAIHGFETQNRVIGERIEEVRLKRKFTGLNSGDSLKDYGAWAELVSSTFKRTANTELQGYRANEFDLHAGVDYLIDRDLMVGLVLGYGRTDIDRQARFDELNYHSLKLAGYTGWDFYDNWFIDTNFGFSFNQYHDHRYIDIPGFERLAKSKYRGIESYVGGNLGYRYGENALKIIPEASFYYFRLDLSHSNENNAGALGLSTHPSSIESWLFGFKTEVGYAFDKWYPYIRGRFSYQLNDMANSSQNQFIGTGVEFITDTVSDPKDSYSLDFGLEFLGVKGMVLDLKYDFTYRRDFRAHRGHLKLRYDW